MDKTTLLLLVYCVVGGALFYSLVLRGLAYVLLLCSVYSHEQLDAASQFWEWEGLLESSRAYVMFAGMLSGPRGFLLFLYWYDSSSLCTLAHTFSVPLQSWNFWLSWMLCPQVYLLYLSTSLAATTPALFSEHSLRLLVFIVVISSQLFRIGKRYFISMASTNTNTNSSSSSSGSSNSRVKSWLLRELGCVEPIVWYTVLDFFWTRLHYLYYLWALGRSCLFVFFLLSCFLLIATCFVIMVATERDLLHTIRYCMTMSRGGSSNESAAAAVGNNDMIQLVKIFATEFLWRMEGLKENKFILRDKLQLPPAPDTSVWEDREDERPSHFMCSLCRGILKLPISTPQGHSYCESCFQAHLDVGNYFDPITRGLFSPSQLCFNRGLHTALEEWMQQHSLVSS